MPQQLGAPGVYIEEVPSGRRVIRAVSTSVAAFVDFFREGPMNTPVRIFGAGEFERIFGGYDTRSEASYQIPQFFTNGGSEAWVIRVAGDDTSTTPATPPTASAVTIADGGGTDRLTVAAANPGEWGDTLRVEIDHDVDESDATDLRFNMRVTRHASTAGNAPVVTSKTFLKLSLDADSARFVETVVNDDSALVSVEVVGTPGATDRPAASGTTGGQVSLSQADLDGLSGQTLELSIEGATPATTATLANWAAGSVTTMNQLRGRIEAAIRAADVSNPGYAGARVTLANGRFRILTGRAGAAYAPADEIAVTGGTAAGTLDLATGGNAVEAAQQYALGDGADGVVPGPTEILGTNAVEPPTGMFALDDVDLFNILCLPAVAELDPVERDSVYSNALSYCEERRAMLILDVPEGTDTVTDMTDLLAAYETAGLRSENAALYFPRLRVSDPANGFRLRSIGASGTMAGLFARTDTARGVWKAPAGIEATLEGIGGLDLVMNDKQSGVLNPLAVNALRVLPVYGAVAWGARTMVGADAIGSEWTYVPVRRLALMLQESLFRGTKWVVFEPNDEPTWANLRLNVGAFMNGLFRQGAFQGATPKEAYYVKCDSETTTQADIDAGIVNVEVGFAPLKPAEFVVIRFRQIVGELEV